MYFRFTDGIYGNTLGIQKLFIYISIIITIWEALVAMATTVWDQSVPKVSHSKWMLQLFISEIG